MQKVVQTLPLIVIAAAVGLIAYQSVEHRQRADNKAESADIAVQKMTSEQLPVDQTLPVSDRQLADQAFRSPETLDGSAVSKSLAGSANPLCSTQVVRLSDLAPEPQVTVTDGTQDAYFQKDFESLRTDTFRNPDSEHNRAIVNTLMIKRQQRLNRTR